ncbi:MAG: flagellar motor switch protein FliN [Candidatus Lambdaproteobacteria bacterium RIFOXYD2_FULL_50_16]|uniref:Flagellar motor switch protein FliN n=1 Tax=Candidatus Lambdaproteobacteria bacterium RIFOXYD2_FULL_50_16 TaxID=1817772 RepID=A0A1F6GAZ2_9PROT|nr:MAG: flagellar motor switch protein FliN [Candidatus Lambdaproteobacteria bacterium RIFOXYD2_FULL_50_16]
MGDDMDFSGMDDSDSIDWSDVEAELQANKEMIKSEAKPKSSGDDDALASLFGGGGGDDKGDSVNSDEGVGVDFLMNIPLTLRVEVGATKMLIKDLLKLDMGSILELTKDVGSPMDILINDKKVAKGEIVVQHEKFALKITDILDKKGRMAKLKG